MQYVQRIPYLLFFILVVRNSFAQSPVITRTNYFEIGDSALLYFKFDTSLFSVDPGAAGEDVLWDFSAIDFEHSSVIVDTLVFIDPVGTPFYPSSGAADYSAANICMLRKTEEFSTENNDYNYYFVNLDSLAFLGHWSANGGTELWEDHYPDPLRELQFALSYPDQFSDQFSRHYLDMSGSGEHASTGTYSVSVDGYGSMITPDGDLLPDVIRLHTTMTSIDSSMFGMQETTIDRYFWYSQQRKGYILSFSMSINDPTLVETATYQRQTHLSTDVIDTGREDLGMRIFPVPSSTSVWIQVADDMKFEELELYNSIGKKVRTIAINSSSIKIEKADLPNGSYSLRAITNDHEVIVGRIIFN